MKHESFITNSLNISEDLLKRRIFVIILGEVSLFLHKNKEVLITSAHNICFYGEMKFFKSKTYFNE